MLWDLHDEKHLYTLDHNDIINALCFSPNRYWLCAATGPSIKIWVSILWVQLLFLILFYVFMRWLVWPFLFFINRIWKPRTWLTSWSLKLSPNKHLRMYNLTACLWPGLTMDKLCTPVTPITPLGHGKFHKLLAEQLDKWLVLTIKFKLIEWNGNKTIKNKTFVISLIFH